MLLCSRVHTAHMIKLHLHSFTMSLHINSITMCSWFPCQTPAKKYKISISGIIIIEWIKMHKISHAMHKNDKYV